MASYTTNLNLKKPAGSENVAIGDINNNMDTIDQAYGTLNNKIGNLQFVSSSLPGNGSKTITIGNDTRCEITIIGGSVNVLDKVIVNSSGSGTVNFKQTENASAITVTSGTNSLTIANTNGITSGLYIFVYSGTVTV